MRFNTLFGKLFAGFCCVILLTATGVWIMAYNAHNQENNNIGRIEWRFIAQKSIDSAVGIYEVAGREGLIRWLSTPRLNTDPVVFVVNREGREISGRAIPEKAATNLAEIRSRTNTEHSDPYKAAIRSIEIDNETWEFFAVRTRAFPARLIPPSLDLFPFAPALSLALFFTLLVSWGLARLYTRSLKTLDEAMRRFADGEFSIRTYEGLQKGDAEVAGLAKVFDGMADKIERLITRQRRLFHDVSHEVRSPLARIDVALELARRSPERTSASLERIQKEVDNINTLAESLLTYARLENGVNVVKSPIGLADVVTGVADDLQFEAQKKQILVKTEIEGDPIIEADGGLLGRALDNIVRNSLRHSPEGGVIHISLKVEDGDYVIQCRDNGPGMPQAEIATMFSPFVRGANVATGSGFGLGLAIAKQSAIAHSGTITARNIEPHGLETTLRLPLSLTVRT